MKDNLEGPQRYDLEWQIIQSSSPLPPLSWRTLNSVPSDSKDHLSKKEQYM